jgi:hypothetical protein
MNQAQDFAGLRVPIRLELGIHELAVDGHLETTPVRWDQRNSFDYVLKFLEQFACQANGPVGVVSDRTVNDLDLKHCPSRLASRRALCNFALFQPSGRLQTLENYNMQRLGLCVGTGERYNPLTVPSPMQGESNANLRLPL